jgi:AcrR family transcriptional regulator
MTSEQDTQLSADETAEQAATPADQDAILQASLKLFAKKGYYNTSLSDIKEAVGISSDKGLQQFFKTKQAIAQAVYEQILDSFSITIDDIRRRNRKASEQLREIVDLLFHLAEEAPEVIQFLFFVNIGEFVPGQLPLLETPAFVKIKRIIQNGIKDGEIRALDPLLAYSYFFGIILHSLQMLLNGALPKSADSYQGQIWIAAWGAIVKK